MTRDEFTNRRSVDLPPNGQRIRRAIADELSFHVEERVRELVASGMDAATARHQALAELGDLAETRRALQDVDESAERRQTLREAAADLKTDLTRTARALARRPGYVAIAVTTLALGIGANAAMFAVVDRLLLSPPPHINDARSVVHLRFNEAQPQSGRITWAGAPWPYVEALAAAPLDFGVAAYTTVSMALRGAGSPRMAQVTAVTPGYFALLGTRPLQGRFLGDGDAAAERAVVISHALWSRELARADVIGSALTLAGDRYTIIGIAPRGFTGATLTPVDAWVALGASMPSLPANWQERQNVRFVSLLARPDPGVTRQALAAQASRIYLAHRAGTQFADSTAFVLAAPLVPGLKPDGEMTTDTRVTVWLQGVSLLVLLIAMANVANLMLLRGLERRRETAVSMALGVSRARLVRLVVLESLLLGALAAVMAMVLSRWCGRVLWGLLLPMSGEVDTTPLREALVVGLLAIGCVMAMSVVPVALQLRTRVGDVLRDAARGSSRRGSRTGNALVVVQVACAVVLVVGSGLFVRSMARLDGQDLGFDVERVVAVHIDHGQLRDAAGAVQFLRQAEARVRALPGIQSVATSLTAPYRASFSPTVFLPGHDRLPGVGPDGLGYPSFIAITPEFFTTMGLVIQRGRGFGAEDGSTSSRVVIVDATMAKTFWPAGDALGRCFRIGADTTPCRTIVGIVQDTRRSPIEVTHSPRYYLPLAQSPVQQTNHYLFARASTSPTRMVAAVRSAVLDGESSPPVVEVLTMTRFLDPYTRPWRLGRAVFVAYGILATFIATVGLYGVISFGILQRRRELGIRVALGATRASVLRLVISGAGRRTALGLAVGGAGAVVLASQLRDLLFRTSAMDAPAFMAAAVVVVLVTVVACIVPALRAVRVDPTVALKAE